MEKQFELKLYNATIATLWVLLSIPLGFTLVGIGAKHIADPKLVLLWAVFILGGGAYGVHRGLKKWMPYPVLIQIKPHQLVMRRLDTDNVTIIPFADVLTYHFGVDKGIWLLRFKLLDGRRQKLQTNDMFGEVPRFIAMVNAVEHAAPPYQRRVPAAMLREKTFFEKPVSTVGLLIFTAITILVVWMGIPQISQRWSGLLLVIGLYLLYVYLWYRGREQRLQ